MSKSLVLILFLVKCSFASYSTKDLLQVALNPRNFIQSLNLDGNKNIEMCQFHLDLYYNQLQNPEDLFMNPWALKSKIKPFFVNFNCGCVSLQCWMQVPNSQMVC